MQTLVQELLLAYKRSGRKWQRAPEGSTLILCEAGFYLLKPSGLDFVTLCPLDNKSAKQFKRFFCKTQKESRPLGSRGNIVTSLINKKAKSFAISDSNMTAEVSPPKFMYFPNYPIIILILFVNDWTVLSLTLPQPQEQRKFSIHVLIHLLLAKNSRKHTYTIVPWYLRGIGSGNLLRIPKPTGAQVSYAKCTVSPP